MRPEYDFSGSVRGATAARYCEGTNVVVVAPKPLSAIPEEESVNEALCSLAGVLRKKRI